MDIRATLHKLIQPSYLDCSKRCVTLSAASVLMLMLSLSSSHGAELADNTQNKLPAENGDVLAAVDPLLRVQTLVRAGVLDLAKAVLIAKDPNELQGKYLRQWEQQLWTLLDLQGAWQEKIARINRYPKQSNRQFSKAFLQRARQQMLSARLELGESAMVREFVRSELQSDISEQQRAGYFATTIESYLADGQSADALAAMQIYQQSYRPSDEDWLLLSAQIYMANGMSAEAINQLAPIATPGARLFGLYARMQSGLIEHQQVSEQVNILREDAAYRGHEGSLLTIATLASMEQDDVRQQIQLLETYLSAASKPKFRTFRGLERFQLADLLASYERLASQQVNALGLLGGDDNALVKNAVDLLGEDAISARSMLVSTLYNAKSKLLRRRAGELLIGSLLDAQQLPLIGAIFDDVEGLKQLPITAEDGLRLINAAIEEEDLALAARINAALDQTPEGMDEQEWRLYSARVAILGGRHEFGAKRLAAWLDLVNELDDAAADVVLQPVFDLQRVNQHQLALPLLNRIYERVQSAKLRRELTYWLGESYFATERYIQAAEFFIHSAMLHADGRDQWGVAARTLAADALAKAELRYDARQLYRDLLAGASSDQQRERIQQKLQDLSLQEFADE